MASQHVCTIIDIFIGLFSLVVYFPLLALEEISLSDFSIFQHVSGSELTL